MNINKKVISFSLAVAILFASCSSSTMIVSNPSSAKLYVDDEMVGETPYRHRDSKIVGSTTSVKIEKEGYMPHFSEFTKNEEADVGAIIGGLFVWIPFLWTMKYKAVHNYELKPIPTVIDIKTESEQIQNNSKSKAVRLRELKQLLDEKIITADDFEKEKAKILELKE
jgi:hypothetical protein